MGPPQAAAEPQAGADGHRGEGVAAVPGPVLRLQHTALPRKAPGRARNQAELQRVEAGVATRRSGEEAQEAWIASQAAAAPSSAWDDAAHRWKRASVVQRR